MPYVRNAWYVASWSMDLAAGSAMAITILGERIAIYRGESGRPFALEDRCVHRFAPLSLGRCEGDRLRCGYHGLLFEASGTVVEIPGQDVIPPTARVKSYPVAERHSWIWVWMGDPDRADPALIPPAIGFDDQNYILGHGQLDYAAEARLINDNLLDFSHLTYVHAGSFQSGAAFADRPARISRIDRGIRYQRWIENSLGSASRATATPMDSFMGYDFLLPGILLMTSAVFPVGTAKACDYGPPRLEEATSNVTFTSQAVTPMDDQTSRYFFSWGPHRAHGDEAVRDRLMQMADLAFAEDKTMIEAQQRVINSGPARPVMPTAHDHGVTLFNRMVERVAREEAEAA